jgi:PAS domain S-box-containing protein
MVAADGREVWLRDLVAVILEDNKAVELRGVMVDVTEAKRAEAELRRRNRELTLLNRVIMASAAEAEPEVVLEIACRELAQTFELPQVAAVLLNEPETEVTVVAEYMSGGWPSLMNQVFPVETLSTLFQETSEPPGPILIENTAHDPRLASVQALLSRHGLISLLILPLVIEGAIVGTVNLGAVEARYFSPEEIDLAWNVAGQVAGSLARARLTSIRRRLIAAIEQTSESVMITTPQGTILYVNPAFEQVTGYSRAEAIGQNPRILRSGKHEAAFYREFWATLKAGQIWRGHFINRKKEGSLYTEATIVTPVRDERGNIVNYVALRRDVTRELQLEEQYRQAQKMEAVGRLAGGVAHDFNNLLTAIMGYIGLALEALPPDSPVNPDLQGIQKTSERAANLTRQLLAFARRQIVELRVIDLNELILNMDKMLRRLISENIELVTLPAPALGRIKADPSQIEQVLLNLVVNACDAMPEGGKLILETANVRLDNHEVHQQTEVIPGEYIMLAVSDTGVGMSEEVKQHIFEPFFTTKGESKGTGLGLATCFGIISQSGGYIHVYSEPGQGATFKVYLPRVTETVAASAWRDPAHELPRGTETILLVEDEASVRRLSIRVLRQQGYTVLEATHGAEALRLAQEQAGRDIHLLLTDMVMPQMGGQELAKRLTHLYPKLKVLFISGYIETTVPQSGLLDPSANFLQKPFTPQALIHKVRAVLGVD